MNRKRISYYGYDRATYDSVAAMRDENNNHHTRILATIFLLIMVVATVLSYAGFIPYAHRKLYLIYSIVALADVILILALKKFVEKHAVIFVYLMVLTLMMFAVGSSNIDSFQLATVFHAYVILVGAIYMDNMLRFSSVIVLSFVYFIYTSYMNKPPSIARYDMIYGVVFTVVSLMFHFMLQRNRMDQYLLFQRNIESQRELEVTSSFDSLSSLLIRARFFSMAGTILRAQENAGRIALCILDLDAFKQINDNYGHQVGDKAIQTAGHVIWDELGVDISEKWSFCERAIRDKISFAGRLGGDEFVIFLREEGESDATEQKLRRILNSLNATRLGSLNGIHASFGVTEITTEDKDIDAVYNRADKALYTAKTSGKNQIVRG